MPDYLPEERIGVIILKREKSSIAESMLRTYCTPLERAGRKWITTPDVRNPLVPPPAIMLSPRATYYLAYALKFAFRCARFSCRELLGRRLRTPRRLVGHELECLGWYVEEIAAQAQAFGERFKGIKYYEVDIGNLNSLGGVEEMFDYFGCTAEDSLNGVIGKGTNLKRGKAQ